MTSAPINPEADKDDGSAAPSVAVGPAGATVLPAAQRVASDCGVEHASTQIDRAGTENAAHPSPGWESRNPTT